MNEVFVLVAKEKYCVDGESRILTAVQPQDIETVYTLVNEYAHDDTPEDYDYMLYYYCNGEVKSIEKYDINEQDFVRWLDVSHSNKC